MDDERVGGCAAGGGAGGVWGVEEMHFYVICLAKFSGLTGQSDGSLYPK